jgi:DNA-directed RNA polymerase subunit RPC12/RpoP
MAEPTPAIQCPACGSTNVAAVPLSLIEAKYYKCGNCVVTFRVSPQQQERPDIERFNRGWSLPPDDKKS